MAVPQQLLQQLLALDESMRLEIEKVDDDMSEAIHCAYTSELGREAYAIAIGWTGGRPSCPDVSYLRPAHAERRRAAGKAGAGRGSLPVARHGRAVG